MLLSMLAMYFLSIGREPTATTRTDSLALHDALPISFKAEMKGDQVVRMMPWKDGQANRGHSCVKGRFAWGYATHKDRILNPMIRKSTSDPWRDRKRTRLNSSH